MSGFTFVTTNEHKIVVARKSCQPLGITFDTKNLDLIEIQADDGTLIARDKVRQAYKALLKPVVITDDNWLIAGLNGFPGAYMKYMNQWLTPDDFLRLTAPLKNRTAILRHILAYKDDSDEMVFTVDIPSILLDETRGESPYPVFTITSFDGGKHSLAEADAENRPTVAHLNNAWHALYAWLKETRRLTA